MWVILKQKQKAGKGIVIAYGNLRRNLDWRVRERSRISWWGRHVSYVLDAEFEISK